METLVGHPKNEKELATIEAILKALEIDFDKKKESPYHPEFVEKIKRGEQAFKEGKGVKVDIENLWK